MGLTRYASVLLVTRHLLHTCDGDEMHRTTILQLYRRLSISPKPHRSRIRPFRPSISMNRVLDFRDGPLVWVDCEMTGLNPRKDKILEIAVWCYDQSFGSQLHNLENRSSLPMEISKLSMMASNMLYTLRKTYWMGE